MFLCFTYIEIIIFPYEITLKFSKIFNTSFVFFYMSYDYSRLNPTSKSLFEKSLMTFPEIKGNLNEMQQTQFYGVLEEPRQIKPENVGNTLSMFRTLCESKCYPEQKFLNKITAAAFIDSKITSHLYVFSEYYDPSNWIFHAICYSSRAYVKEFQNSLKESYKVWEYFSHIIYNECLQYMDMLYLNPTERSRGFLVDAIVFNFETERESYVSLDRLIESLVPFLLDCKITNSICKLVSAVCLVYTEESFFHLSSRSMCHVLTTDALSKIINMGLAEKSPIRGEYGILAVKLLSIDIELAKSFNSKSKQEDQEIFEEILSRYDVENKRFVPN